MDIVVILVAIFLVLYLASPDLGEFKLEMDPLVMMVVVVTIVMFLASM